MSNNAPKTVEIGAQGLADLFARREAKRDAKTGLAQVSEDKLQEMRRMMAEFHTPVNRRDARICQYCLLFRDTPRDAARPADHILTQKLWPEFKFDIWNGVACCKWCNENRGLYGTFPACIMQTKVGVIQFVNGIIVKTEERQWFGRLLAPAAEDADGKQIWKGYGDHVGEWKPIPPEEWGQLRNNVLLKEAA
jgi:hypothetical protein